MYFNFVISEIKLEDVQLSIVSNAKEVRYGNHRHM